MLKYLFFIDIVYLCNSYLSPIIIALYSSRRLVFLTKVNCIFCEAYIESLHNTQINFSLQMIKEGLSLNDLLPKANSRVG